MGPGSPGIGTAALTMLAPNTTPIMITAARMVVRMPVDPAGFGSGIGGAVGGPHPGAAVPGMGPAGAPQPGTGAGAGAGAGAPQPEAGTGAGEGAPQAAGAAGAGVAAGAPQPGAGAAGAAGAGAGAGGAPQTGAAATGAGAAGPAPVRRPVQGPERLRPGLPVRPPVPRGTGRSSTSPITAARWLTAAPPGTGSALEHRRHAADRPPGAHSVRSGTSQVRPAGDGRSARATP